jgi:hypothetical protein
MSDPRIKYGVDSAAERQGAPVVIDDMEFLLRSSLDVNRGYRYALALAYDRRRADFEKGGIEAFEAQVDITMEAFADRVILGWRNVTNGHGELEFNRENCIRLMQDCPKIWEQLQLAALDESRFKPAPAREDGEQLGKS